MRINKFLAGAGLGSRRKCEDLVREGRVVCNGMVVSDLGFSVDEKKDKVLVDGKQVLFAEEFDYVMLHKPKGVITSMSDEHGRKTVVDIMPEMYKKLKPVGRLDYDSEGLLIMTNDGDLAYVLSHPSNEITKTYVVKVEGEVKESQLAVMRAGVVIDGVRLSKCKVRMLEKVNNGTKLEVVISEGKNRQVRKMFDAVGLNVVFLKRTQIGELRLGGLARGKCRSLSPQEILYLKSL
ncbi:MAG: rRNA pseudouridine synthase [Clostridia bacterium]|nr:rRNA pseudouridine synthase [Clostridia bacterium]